MAKIGISENELSKLIKKSILKEINELPVAGQKYTLADLLNKIDYNGNASDLIRRAENTENTPENWAKIIRGAAKNAAQKIAYEQIAKNIESFTTNRQAVAQGMMDKRNDFDDIRLGQTGRYDISGNLYSQIMQIAGGLAQAAGETYTVRTFLQAAQNQGALQGQTEESIKKAISNKINSGGITLSKTNPSAYKKYSWVLQKWMEENHPYRISEIRDALAAFGQVLNTSRNEIPTVMGLQKALNYFSIKDTKGRPFKVDGVIGNETSTALANAGFKDIYEWKETITNYQKMHNVPPRPDGIVGDNTLKAFQASNLTNINQLSRYKPGSQQANVAQVSSNSANAISNNLNGANKVTMSESELKQIIRESVESVLLNEDMQSRRNRKYEDALTNYNNAQKTWDQLNSDEKKPWMINAGGDEIAGRNAYEYAQKTRVANAKAKLDKRTRRNGLQFQQDLQTANSQLKNLYAQLGAEDYKTAAEALTNLKTNLQTTQSKLSVATENATKWENAYNSLRTTNAELTKANQNLKQQIAAANKARTQNTAASALNRQTTTAQVSTGIPGANKSASALNTNPQRTAATGTAKV